MRSKFVNWCLLIFFVFFLLLFLVQVGAKVFKNPITRSWTVSKLANDKFDSSLSRLNTVKKISDYCDSIYHSDSLNLSFPEVVSRVLRFKFYHGYSYYEISDNILAVLIEPIVGNGANAIVVPDDIVKYPMAACSQQSLVGMELFRQKNYPVRKIVMYDSLSRVGHFTFEVYYDKGWHYFDIDQEPKTSILEKYSRPSAAFLASNLDIVMDAYKETGNPELFKRLFMNYKTGVVNKFPAPNAYFLQLSTKWIGYFGWIFMLIIIFLRYRLKNNRITRHLQKYNAKQASHPILS